jgi:tRNA (guanine-N7-)-methyltransferase
MSPSDDPAHRPLRSFGRIKSRAIKPRQAALFDTLLPGIARCPIRRPARSIPAPSCPTRKRVWLEIGFGGGEHLAAQADRAIPTP